MKNKVQVKSFPSFKAFLSGIALFVFSAAATSPSCNADFDGDGMSNAWEASYDCVDGNVYDADQDPDGDGLTNYLEYVHDINPCSPDTDGDGGPDGWETHYACLDPAIDDNHLEWLNDSGWLEGKVTDHETGISIVNCKVSITQGDTILHSTYTSSDGSYLIPALLAANATHQVTFEMTFPLERKSGYAKVVTASPVISPGVSDRTSMNQVLRWDPDPTRDVGQIFGTIKEEDTQQPIGWALEMFVGILNVDVTWDGKYTMALNPDDSNYLGQGEKYLIYANVPGYEDYFIGVDDAVTVGNGQTVEHNIVLKPKEYPAPGMGKMYFEVKDESGGQMGGVRIEVKGGYERTLYSNTEAPALFLGEAGIYNIKVEAPGYGDHVEDIILKDKDSISLTVNLELVRYDYDNDGLHLVEEYGQGTDPCDPDFDEDGMPDGWEVDSSAGDACILDPLVPDMKDDPDEDGLINGDEYIWGSDPCDPVADADFDGLTDVFEIKYTPTEFTCINDNNCASVDGCDLYTYPEHNNYLFCSAVRRWEEARDFCRSYGGDLAAVGDEAEDDWIKSKLATLTWLGYHQDPEGAEPDQGWRWSHGSPITYEGWGSGKPDNNGDQDCAAFWTTISYDWEDYGCEQFDYSFDFVCEDGFPLNPHSPDSDGDGLDDKKEIYSIHGNNPNISDTDGDGLNDKEEIFTYETNPLVWDTDGDGMPDGWEAEYSSCGIDPIEADDTGDLDGDSITNLDEYIAGSDPCLGTDNDGDGIPDGLEAFHPLLIPGATDKLIPETGGNLFPVCVVGAEGHEREIRDAGFNCIQPYSYFVDTQEKFKAYIEFVASYGLFINVGYTSGLSLWDGATLSEVVDEFIDDLAGYNNIAWWVMKEEQNFRTESEEMAQFQIDAYDNDPRKRPGFMFIAFGHWWTTVRILANYIEVIGVEPYADLLNSSRTMFKWYLEEVAIKGIDNRVKIPEWPSYIYVPYNIPVSTLLVNRYGHLGAFHEIQPNEAYHDAWLSIISGARGLVIYNHHNVDSVPEGVWESYKKVADQVAKSGKLGPVILSGHSTKTFEVEVVDGATQARPLYSYPMKDLPIKKYPYPSINWMERQDNGYGYRYLFVVNSADDEVEVKIRNVENCILSVDVLFEGRAISIEECTDCKEFTDTFNPYGVHIYRMDLCGQ